MSLTLEQENRLLIGLLTKRAESLEKLVDSILDMIRVQSKTIETTSSAGAILAKGISSLSDTVTDLAKTVKQVCKHSVGVGESVQSINTILVRNGLVQKEEEGTEH